MHDSIHVVLSNKNVTRFSLAVTTDAKIHDIAVAYILKQMCITEWPFTVTPYMVIGALHPSFVQQLSLADEELVIVSAYFSNVSWYAFTTRRIVSQFQGVFQSLDPTHGIEADFPNFKGYAPGDCGRVGAEPHPSRVGVIRRDVATITAIDTRAIVRFEYETWEASAVPQAAVGYWRVKHPYLHKLMTAIERGDYKTRNG